MPTVIDSLIVKLGLDTSNFSAGQKKAAQSWLDTKKGAQTAGSEIESTARKSGEFINQLTGRVLLLMAAFTGGKGAKAWAQDLVTANAAMGRMAVLVGTTTVELSKWSGATTAMGGSVGSATGSIQSLNNSLVQLQLTGESGVIPYLRSLQAFAPSVNLSLMGANGQMRTAVDMLPDLHKAVQGMDAARASVILSGLGLGQDLINILIQSRETFDKFMQDQQRWGVVTKEQANAAQDLQYKASGVRQSFDTLGRMLIQTFGPAVGKVMDRLTELFVWFQNNPDKLRQTFLGITAAVIGLGIAFGGPIAWIAALVAAIGLLYDDWRTWNEGGKAQFGDFWQFVTDKWRDIRDVAIQTWNDVKGTVLPIFDAIVSAFKGMIQIVVNSNKLIYELFFGTSESIKNAWGNLLSSIGDQWDNLWHGLAKSIYDAAPAIYDAIKKAFTAAFSWVMDRANVIYKAITGEDLFKETSKDSRDVAMGGTNDTSATAGKGSPLPGNEQAGKDIDYLMKKHGRTREEASAMVANVLHENGGRIHNPHMDSDGLIHDGLIAWSPARRRDFERKMGKPFSSSTREEQYDFYNWETFQGGDAGSDRVKRTAARPGVTAGEIAASISTNVIRPADTAGNARVRAVTAQGLYRTGGAGPSAGLPQPPLPTGAPLAAISGPMARFGQPAPLSSMSSEVNIQNLTVNTQATDAEGIVADMKPAIERNSFTANANYGPL